MKAPPRPIRGRCDATDRLLEADEPLAGMQLRMGGELPGVLALPELLALVRAARRHGLRLSRTVRMLDEGTEVAAWATVDPGPSGCTLELSQWRAGPAPELLDAGEGEGNLIRHLAEGYAWLDGTQRVLAWDLAAADLTELQQAFASGKGRPWTDFVEIAGNGHRQPLHWRLLDKASVRIAGSDRSWRAHILPRPGLPGTGFELYLLPEEITSIPEPAERDPQPGEDYTELLGRELAPALRQPINRIIANADMIRTRLAGPLAEQYSLYAADICNAGQHLLNLVEDLADLEAVEAPDFRPVVEPVDLAALGRQAGSLLSVRAGERAIALVLPPAGQTTQASGEQRRVLQILLNLLSNAIRYSPENTTVTVSADSSAQSVWVAVADEGAGLEPEQAAVVFDKFQRLGRKGDGGSGLGLYISRRLARAMGGDLVVESHPGKGARFVLTLPHYT